MTNDTTFTLEMIEEFQLCFNPVYFTEKYTLKRKLSQKEICWLTMSGDIKMGAERASGRTTLALSRLLHNSIFYPDKTYCYLTANVAQVKSARTAFKDFYDQVPDWMRPKVREAQGSQIVFDNYSRVMFLRATPHACRGMTFSGLVIDNTSLIKPEAFDELIEYVAPCLGLNAPGTFFITAE